MQELSKDIIVTICVTLFLLLMTSFIVAFVVYHTRRQGQFLYEKTQLQQQFQEEILRTQLEIQEQTLKTISQEIHDNIGQTLSLAKLNLNTIDLEKQNGVQEKIYNSKELVSKAIHNLRDLSRSLNTDTILSRGLVKGIETALSMIEKAGVMHTELTTSGQPIRIDPKKELILFRIVQEAINNIIKHSDSDKMKVEVQFGKTFLKIAVKDDGKGFETNQNHEGAGLRNMNSRAQLVGGNFDLQTSSNGTIISVTIPISES